MATNAEGGLRRSPTTDHGMNGGLRALRPPAPVPDLEKRAALEQVLGSAAFLRAEQLRNFLRYICEMELAGRAAELSEYLIGVEALGRPPGYSTADDSTVRRRAHALRQKLDDVYAGELAEAKQRIELPKGSYAPRFVPAPAPAANAVGRAAGGEREASSVSAPREARARRLAGLWLAAAFVLGAGAAAAVSLWPGRSTGQVDPVVVDAWGPFARPGANVLISITPPPHLAFLPYPEGPLPPRVSALEDPELLAWYHQLYPLRPQERVGTHKTTGPMRLGDVLGLVTAVRTLDRLGADFQIVADRSVTLPTLRGRNVILFGNPEYSSAVAKLLDRAAWTVAYDPARRDRVVRSLRGDAPAVVAVPSRDAEEQHAEVLGLLTVLPTDGAADAHPRSTVVVSCTHNAGCHGALEFFSSPSSLRGLRDRFLSEGQAGFPPAYQVVVRSRVDKSQAYTSEYEAHVVLKGTR